ncbi:hypothetical protein [Rhodopseudomonas palustris]|nr:hypothetical protein [Rhodopseudomonas palustris]
MSFNVIASAAKQSKATRSSPDCFAASLLAMTTERMMSRRKSVEN